LIGVAVLVLGLVPPVPSAIQDADVDDVEADLDVDGFVGLEAGEDTTVEVTAEITEPGDLDDDTAMQVLGELDGDDADDVAVASVEDDDTEDLDVVDGRFLAPTTAEAPTVDDLTDADGETIELELTPDDDVAAGELTLEVSLAVAGGDAESERLFGADRFETAANISEDRYPDGADTVYLARSDDFPDALAAGPSAADDEAPLLLTEPDALHETTEDELERLDPDEVVLLGGDNALSDDVEDEVAELVDDTSRVFGADRVETAAEIASDRFDAADTVLIARDDDFADALAGVPAAFALDAPVLLTDQDELSEAAEEVIDELDPDEAILLGGDAAVATSVEDDLDPLVDDVERVSGTGRAETAAEIALELFDAEDVDSIFLATGNKFPDALAGGPVAAVDGAPMLLTTSLPDEVEEAIEELGVSKVTGLGGDAVLSDDDLDATAEASSSADRPERAEAATEDSDSSTGDIIVPDDDDEPELDASSSSLAASGESEEGEAEVTVTVNDGDGGSIEGLDAEAFSFDVAVAVDTADEGPEIGDDPFDPFDDGSGTDSTSDNLIVITDVPVPAGNGDAVVLPAYVDDSDELYDDLTDSADLIDDSSDTFESTELSDNELAYDEWIADYEGDFKDTNDVGSLEADSGEYTFSFENDSEPKDSGFPALFTQVTVEGESFIDDADNDTDGIDDDSFPGDPSVLPVPVFTDGLYNVDASSSSLAASGESEKGEAEVTVTVNDGDGGSIEGLDAEAFSFDVAVAVDTADEGPEIGDDPFDPFDDGSGTDSTSDNLIVITDVPVPAGNGDAVVLPAYVDDSDELYDDLTDSADLIDDSSDTFESTELSDNELAYDEWIADYEGDFKDTNDVGSLEADSGEYTFSFENDSEPKDSGFPALFTQVTVEGESFIDDADNDTDGIDDDSFPGDPSVLPVPVFTDGLNGS